MSVNALDTSPRRAASTTTARDDRAAVDKAMALLASFELDELDEGLGVSELARRSGSASRPRSEFWDSSNVTGRSNVSGAPIGSVTRCTTSVLRCIRRSTCAFAIC